MRTFRDLTLAVCLVSLIPAMGQVPGDNLFDNSRIHEIRIVSIYENLHDTLDTNYIMSFGINQIQFRDIPYAPAKLIIDGTVLDTLGIRYKGFNSWWHSVKKPLKIDINRYKSGQEYDGLKKFNLHNGSGDPSFIRENTSYKILRSLGIKAPRTSFAQVFLDTTYMGVYRIVEQVDNTFLDVNFGNHKGNLYVQEARGTAGISLEWEGADQEAYYESISLENHQIKNDWSGFIHFLDILNNTSERDFRDSIVKVFDVDEYLQVFAFDLAVNNLDFYGNSGRNFYLYSHNGIFHWIPWDYNLTWREGTQPLKPDPADYPILIRRILQVPEFSDTFLRKYCQLKSFFSETDIDQLVDTEASAISEYLRSDPYMDYPFEAFQKNIDSTWIRIPGLKPFAAQRYLDILKTLESSKIDCNVSTETTKLDLDFLKLYPLPAKEWVNISPIPYHDVRVSVFSLCGQLVIESACVENGRFNISHLPSGCYVVKVIDGENVCSKLLIVGD